MDTDNEVSSIRRGEDLDEVRLTEYLRDRMPTPFETLEVVQFPGGTSNLTYLIRVGDEEFVLRRPPFGNTVKTAHDMKREFDVLSKLAPFYTPAPKPLLYCDDESVIGSEFYLMESRHGLIIRGSVSSLHVSNGSPYDEAATSQFDRLNSSQEYRIQVCRNFLQNLANLHAIDYTAAGLGDLGRPEGYNRRQVEGWTKRYFAARTDEHPELEQAIIWLNDNIPAESGASLIHNDYKFDNIMLDSDDLTRTTAVLDWEMVTVGDPLMDLGTTLGYWISPDAGDKLMNMPFNPRILMENFTRQALADMYAAARGRDLPDLLFYYVFGTFKIAAIAQQIYRRYVSGFTKDPRFESFGKFVEALGRIAHNSIDSNSI